MARKQLETLTEQMYYILLALHAPRHGYAVMQYVQRLTEGRVQLGAGTLYTLLNRFEKDGYIALFDQGGGRNVYELTETGRTLFEKERARLKLVLQDSEQVLGGELDE